jgi:hypothetical protein
MKMAPSKPQTFNADLANLPAALLPLINARRWVIWKWELRGPKWTKPPYQLEYINQPAKSNDPATWGEHARAVLVVGTGQCDGIGFMLKGGKVFAIDLDHIRDVATGEVLGWAQALLAEAVNAGCYLEWTVSGTGARIIGLSCGGELHRRIFVNRKNNCAIEFYRNCGRYITISGMQIASVAEMNTCDSLFDALFERFGDDTRRPPAASCEFIGGMELAWPGGLGFDLNSVGPQNGGVDYDDLLKNGAPQGDRSEEFQRLVWHLLAQGKSEAEIVAELANHPNGIAAKYAGRLPQEVRRSTDKWKTQRQASANGTMPPASGPIPNPGSSWPTIYIKSGELPRMLNEIDDALVDLGHELYAFGGQIVRPQLDVILTCGGREYSGWRLVQIAPSTMIVCMSCAALWLKYDGRRKSWVQADPPALVADAYLRRGKWKSPKITGITNTPFLRADGSVCEREGYDLTTGLLCKWQGVRFPCVPVSPTRDDALAALTELEKPFAEFPFVAPIDKSAALSAALTALDRRGMDVAPIHAFTAPSPGTGKGLLIDAIVTIATGRPVAPLMQARHEEELNKTLGAALIAGDAFISIDNCDYPLVGSILNTAVRQPVFKIRILGVSHNAEIPNSAMFFANGNNLQIGADLTRRVIYGELDAKMERPETREFKDTRLLDTVGTGRGALVTAGLTVLRAWQLARPGERERAEREGRAIFRLKPLDFVSWSERVREALVWLGRDDPGETMRHLRENDPYRVERGGVFEEWFKVLGERGVLVREVIEAAFDHQRAGNDAFLSALLVVAVKSGNSNEISPDRLGRWLTKNKGGIVNDLMLVLVAISSQGPIWRIKKV